MLRNKLTPKSLASLRKTEPQEAPGPHWCWNPTEELEERKTQHAGEAKPQRPAQENSWIGAVSTGLSWGAASTRVSWGAASTGLSWGAASTRFRWGAASTGHSWGAASARVCWSEPQRCGEVGMPQLRSRDSPCTSSSPGDSLSLAASVRVDVL